MSHYSEATPDFHGMETPLPRTVSLCAAPQTVLRRLFHRLHIKAKYILQRLILLRCTAKWETMDIAQ